MRKKLNLLLKITLVVTVLSQQGLSESASLMAMNDFIKIKIETPKTEDNDIVFREKDNESQKIKKLRKENARLKKRIRKLERAVIQIQDYISESKEKTPEAQEKVVTWSCMAKANVSGTYLGEGPSKVAAEARAIQSCESSGGHFCDRKVTCSKS